jgi:hypothetical protein
MKAGPVSLSRGCPLSGEDPKTFAYTEFFSVLPRAELAAERLFSGRFTGETYDAVSAFTGRVN